MLPEPRTDAGRAALAAVLAAPARAVLAVDFDGTLAPIVARPEDARPADGAVEALRRLADRLGVVAVVSGRAAEDVVRLGDLDRVSRLVVLGHYGLERRVGGRLDSPPVLPAVDEARRRLPALLADAADGVHVEDKTHSLVVHTRPAPEPGEALAELTLPLCALAAELGLEAVPGRYVLELRPPGVDKGTAVRRLVAEHEAAAVIYAGDDLGDLPAYAAVVEGRAAGVAGLTVASAGADAPAALAEQADLVLDGPTGVVQFLDALSAAIGQP